MDFFAPDSMIRRVHGEQVVSLYGPRALLIQAAHPLAFAGLIAHTAALDAPYERLARTARTMDRIIFGGRQEAESAGRRVRAMHHRVRGELREPAGRFAAGTPYAASDPALLLWILAAIADSAVVVFERYVRGLSPAELDALWQDYRHLGELLGLQPEEMPADWAAFRRYMTRMLAGDELEVTPAARELALQIVLRPPVPVAARPLLELANFITAGLLPRRLRREYGLGWDPVRGLALSVGAQYAKRVLVPLLPGRVRRVRAANAALSP